MKYTMQAGAVYDNMTWTYKLRHVQ